MTGRTWLVALIALGALAAAVVLAVTRKHGDHGAGDKPADEPEHPMPPLLTEQALSGLEDRLMAEVEQARAMHCVRPVLRGDPVPGPADADIVAAVEPTGELATCLSMLAADPHGVTEALYLPVEGRGDAANAQTDEGAWRVLRRARPPDDPAGQTELIGRAETACEVAERAVSTAVQHDDACSPYRPGVRATPDLGTVPTLARALAIRARLHARNGDAEGALHLLLDGIRLAHDVGRGAPWLPAAIGLAAMDTFVVELEALLSGEVPLSTETLRSVAAELDRLISTAPHPSEPLLADLQHLRLYTLMPSLKPAGWAPPGGFGPDEAPSQDELVDREQAGVALLALERLAPVYRDGCPEGSSQEACLTGLRQVARTLTTASSESALDLRTLLGKEEDEIPQVIRESFIPTLQVLTVDSMLRYESRLMHGTAFLAALRLLVEIRLAAPPGSRCPSLQQALELTGARHNAVLGGELKIWTDEQGALEIGAPEWLARPEARPTEVRLPLVRLRCPDAGPGPE